VGPFVARQGLGYVIPGSFDLTGRSSSQDFDGTFLQKDFTLKARSGKIHQVLGGAMAGTASLGTVSFGRPSGTWVFLLHFSQR